MLTLTENAQTLVRDLTAQPEIPDGGGLRIAPAASSPAQLQLSVAAGPEPGDDVVDAGGARVFVESQTSELLGDSTLDAQSGTEGPQFVLTQGAPPA